MCSFSSAISRRTIFLIGIIAPVTFDIWVTAIIFVLLVINFLISSISTSPLSLHSANFIIAPFFSLIKCHGT